MRCQAMNAQGEQCRAPALIKERFCVTHHPDHQEARQESRRRGGVNARSARSTIRIVDEADTPGTIETLEDVANWLRWCAMAVATGKLDARTGHEIVAALKELRPTLEKVGIEEEVRKLRDELAAAKKGRAK